MSARYGTMEPKWPRWLRSPMAKLAAVTAFVAAIAAFLIAIGDFGKGFKETSSLIVSICRTVTLCKADPGPPPTIPVYISDWVDGGKGKSTDDYCLPVLADYQKKYPNFTITRTILPEQHNTTGEGPFGAFKHDIYKYSCSFTATPK